ncbi:MAG TPA: CPBP family intramembrane glutamic endopeptidase [Bryobacteraceae bacterium]|nr:CPBP family intramembrane glutamic endopeptidase [Bryobacteraceae bacterium]
MSVSDPPRPDPFRPLLGAGLYAFGYYVLLNIVATVAQFLGRELVAATVPPLVTASVLGALAMAIFESRRLSDLGLYWRAGTARNLLTGLAIGAGGAALLIAAPLLTGIAHFEPVADIGFSPRAGLFMVALLFCGAAGEEIAFRGFPLQFMMRGYGNWPSILGIGILFGLLHGFNPGATPLSMANTAGFGVLFGMALLRSHDLWLPIGLHFGWNATLPFLGVELSGFTIQVVGYRLVWKAGNLWSGGSYGPEASLLASMVLVILFVVVWRIPVHRGFAYLLDGDPADSEAAGSPAVS